MVKCHGLRSAPAFSPQCQGTSYIGRETDKETDLGFGACPEALRGSVRMYDPTYGRFLSVDPLWGKYLPLQSYQYCRNNPIMRTDRSGMADFFDENGKLIGNNGIDDGLKFIGNASVYQSYQKDGYSFDDMTQLPGVYQLPSASALTAMESSIIDKASSTFSTDSRREYGGVIGDDGNFYAAPKGPVATGESQGPMVNLAPAIAAAEASGSRPLSLVHSHVNFQILEGVTSTSVLQGNKTPSDVDRGMLKDQKMSSLAYGLVIFPKKPAKAGYSIFTFFRADANTKTGQSADVSITHDKVKGIVEGSGK